MEASRSAAVSATARVERDPDLARRGPEAYVAELIGTLLLVFFIAVILTVHSQGVLGVTDWAVIGLVHFLVLAMLIHTLGGASGGHFNPAVTVTLAALRKIGPVDAAIYIVAQIVGAFLGVLLCKLILDNEGDAVGYGATAIGAPLEDRALLGFVVEAMGTFALMWAIMGVAVNPKGARDWAGLTIGGTLGFAVMCFGPLTGAGLNPARALAPSVIGGGEPFGEFLVAYVLGPLVGALLAGMLYTAGILGPAGKGTGRREIDTLSGAQERLRDEGARSPGDPGDVRRGAGGTVRDSGLGDRE